MKKIVILTLFVLGFLFFASDTFAQCAMCAATAESSHAAGDTTADGINKGVLYLFLTPYLIAATIGYFWWRSRRKARLEAEAAGEL